MITLMYLFEIINEHRKVLSFRKIANLLRFNRKTVAKICHGYNKHTEKWIANQKK